ncbi:hypothetical protein SCHPADRAFT_1002748 [Schizopora paradoxa]|uniref:Uncharacterized protein n=1 Tax=Schizopora paradoxa TaxID=27342 RepID=A0A0H2R2Z5_9AGAM|nr:hypothetical protein SCHPADRAFT_1002748 [Schizopora paradoxa]
MAHMREFHQRKVPFEKPASPSSRETLFNVESVSVKLNLLHDMVGRGLMSKRGCQDEFGSFAIVKIGINQRESTYAKTSYTKTYPNLETFYYENKDASFYIANPDGSEFYIDCDGSEWYAPPRPEHVPVLNEEEGNETNMDVAEEEI